MNDYYRATLLYVTLRHATPGRVMPRHVTPVSYEHENDWDYENVNCDNEGVIFRFE